MSPYMREGADGQTQINTDAPSSSAGNIISEIQAYTKTENSTCG